MAIMALLEQMDWLKKDHFLMNDVLISESFMIELVHILI